MMKKYIITAIITLALIIGITFLFKGNSNIGFDTNEDYFIAITETTLNQEYGDTFLGYEPAMLINIFPGIVNEDFEGVSTGYGKYEVINKGIAFRPDPGETFTESKLQISPEGMSTLLQNLSIRLGIELIDESSVEDIIRIISQ